MLCLGHFFAVILAHSTPGSPAASGASAVLLDSNSGELCFNAGETVPDSPSHSANIFIQRFVFT